MSLDQATIDRLAAAPVASGRLLIEGQWLPGEGGETPVLSPIDGRQLTILAAASPADVARACASARAAFEDGRWSRLAPSARKAVLHRLADLIDRNAAELAVLGVRDNGTEISMALKAEPGSAAATFRYYAEALDKVYGEIAPTAPNVLALVHKEPVGVVGAINPWNGPIGLAIWKLCPVLASGCTMVLKPAEQAPLSPLRLAELCMEAGIPPGVFNVVTGMGDAGAALAEHPGVDKIAFTGSTEVGQKIVRASAGNLKRLSMELGGKSANIVFADADLELAVRGAAMAVFGNSGQICSAGTRLYVQRPIYDEFVERVAAFAGTLRVGPSLDPQTQLGPLVSREQLDRVMSYVSIGREQGARAAAGGSRPNGPQYGEGYFVQPTVFADVHDDMRIAREEIFGPVVAAMPFDDINEVVRRANDSAYGLAGGIWTRSLSTAHRVSTRVRTGTVWVNCYQVLDPAVPFGGYKMSGYGRESGVEHMNEYLQTKAVWIRTE